MTSDAVGPPPSPPGYGHVTGPRYDVTGHVIAQTEFSPLLRVPPPPDLPVNGGVGVSVGPAVCYGPGAISMKEDWVQGAPLQLHTQLHTHFVPHTMAAVKDCPLQSSFRAV